MAVEGGDQDRAFTEAKSLLQSHCLLTHYDCSKHLTLACHVSPYGVGVVLSHKLDYSNKKPIAYMSRMLNKTSTLWVANLFSENKDIPMNGICQSNQMGFEVKWL